MMKKFLKSKKGVTLLEGLIALMLLALVATGTFAVLLSSSRKSSQPDIREEMALAIDRASQMLQVYTLSTAQRTALGDTWTERFANGLCNAGLPTPGQTRNINCMLPPMCDTSNNRSYFKYTVVNTAKNPRSNLSTDTAESVAPTTSAYPITFEIVCNGFTL